VAQGEGALTRGCLAFLPSFPRRRESRVAAEALQNSRNPRRRRQDLARGPGFPPARE
jgi:hypothetical protein